MNQEDEMNGSDIEYHERMRTQESIPMNTIIEKQKEFQRFVGFPIDSILESDRDKLSEIYLFKLIEEVVELRKEIPSTMNQWSKKNGFADKTRVMEELADVIFFLMNFCITWKLSKDQILEYLDKVQQNNFQKVKEKKMQILNDEMLQLPGYTIGIGQGNLSPKYVFIGQNPGHGINHGYKVWSNSEDGSSKILLPLLGDRIIAQSYFTNLVKSTTQNNELPSEDMSLFWKEYLRQELDILRVGNPNMVIIAMGRYVQENLGDEFEGILVYKIIHPSFYLRNGEIEKYGKEIQKTIAHIG